MIRKHGPRSKKWFLSPRMYVMVPVADTVCLNCNMGKVMTVMKSTRRIGDFLSLWYNTIASRDMRNQQVVCTHCHCYGSMVYDWFVNGRAALLRAYVEELE